jgi:hypothetical protein
MRTFQLPRVRVPISAILLSGSILLAPDVVRGQNLTFDDVATNAQGINNNFSNYNGFVFEGFNVATITSLGTGSNAASGTKFALGREDLSALYVTAGAFNFFSASLSFRQFDALNPDNGPVGINVVGYRTGIVAPVFSQFVLLTGTAQPFVFNFVNVEEVDFETEALTANGRTVALAMDNAIVAVVPEPATQALVTIGLASLALLARRKRLVR